MNLSQTLNRLRPDRIQATTDNRFCRQIASVLKGTDVIPHWLDYACNVIQRSIRSDLILLRQPISAVEIVTIIDNNTVVGRYEPETRKIFLRETAALRVYAFMVFFHEFGHHLSEMFLNPKMSELSGTDYAYVKMLSDQVRQEFNEYQARLNRDAGHPLMMDKIDDGWKELWALPEEGPSRYAHRNPREWIAEIWTWYFSGEAGWLKVNFPKSFEAVDAVASGSVLNLMS